MGESSEQHTRDVWRDKSASEMRFRAVTVIHFITRQCSFLLVIKKRHSSFKNKVYHKNKCMSLLDFARIVRGVVASMLPGMFFPLLLIIPIHSPGAALLLLRGFT